MLGASIRLFNWGILKGETLGVAIRGKELAADFGRVWGRESGRVGEACELEGYKSTGI